MLRNLVHSRHKMIAQASSAALKNLETSSTNGSNLPSPLTAHPSPSPQSQSSSSTSLQARKQKALEQEIDKTLTEMCDHMDPLSPLDDQPITFDRSRMYRSMGGHYGRSRSSLAPPTTTVLGQMRNQRSSSLERSKQQQQIKPVTTTRSPWLPRSNETNEISYTSLNYEEDQDDQPVNYSLKYTEVTATTKHSAPVTKVCTDSSSEPAAKKDLVLSAYRETDLDEPTEQPTDFSLRYGDPDDEDEDYDASDTMQTYCMEGTPYETPFTRSSAASLTDLREAGLKGTKQNGDQTPPLPRGNKTVTFNEEMSNGNTVANNTVNGAEQTPLMFSRSSSLASLDSLDQLDGQGQRHDEGSVLSEFSRLTSRAVSPSELPDSPGQTMPSSPRGIKKPSTPPPPPPAVNKPDVFEDSTNAFGMEEGQTPAFGTRAASPLSQLSFDDEPSSPPPPAVQKIPEASALVAPPPTAPPPLLAGNRAPMALPTAPLVRPDLNRVVKSTSEVNFRNHFDYDESRAFNEEDSPALTRCTSLSSLHIDGEVIATVKRIQPLPVVVTERKTIDPPAAVVVVPVAKPLEPPQVHSAEWSEDESGSEDDLLLEDIITLGRKPTASKAPAPPIRSSSTSLTKSASAQSLQQPVASSSSSLPVSRSNIDFTAPPADSADASDDDDEMLYACIKSAKPKAKPVPPPRTSSIKSSSIAQHRSRPPLPVPSSVLLLFILKITVN